MGILKSKKVEVDMEEQFSEEVLIIGPLGTSVMEAVKELPKGSHGIKLVIYMDGFSVIEGATIHGLPVRFMPVTSERPAGFVEIFYGVGNLE